MKKYIISGPGPDGIEDIRTCSLDKGYGLRELRNALKIEYNARVAKPGEGKNLPHKHYSSIALLFG